LANAIVIPSQDPIYEIELVPSDDETSLDQLQNLVGGSIEAVPLPDFIGDAHLATAYVNEDGKYTPDCAPNMRATDFMVPGAGLFYGDYIAGTMVVTGFDLDTGEHADIPEAAERRIRKIEREAA
jgi:hypothetical protein